MTIWVAVFWSLKTCNPFSGSCVWIYFKFQQRSFRAGTKHSWQIQVLLWRFLLELHQPRESCNLRYIAVISTLPIFSIICWFREDFLLNSPFGIIFCQWAQLKSQLRASEKISEGTNNFQKFVVNYSAYHSRWTYIWITSILSAVDICGTSHVLSINSPRLMAVLHNCTIALIKAVSIPLSFAKPIE